MKELKPSQIYYSLNDDLDFCAQNAVDVIRSYSKFEQLKQEMADNLEAATKKIGEAMSSAFDKLIWNLAGLDK